jgi:amino acid transporter
MMSVAALLATASSVNANSFAAQNLTASLAASRQFPPLFGGKAPLFGTRGLAISVAIVLGLALFLDLSQIADIGSAVALAIFSMVGIAGFRLRKETNSSALVIIAAIALDLIVLAFFLVDTAHNKPRVFVSMLVVFALTVVFDLWWKAARDKPAARLQPGSPTQ